MNGIIHRLSMVLALAAFSIAIAISLAAGVSILGTILRATLGFAVVGAISRVLLGTTCATIARDLAGNEFRHAGLDQVKSKQK